MMLFKNLPIKVLVGIFIFSFAHYTSASDNEKPKRSYIEYLTHPTTLLCTGISALGGYCWYDSEARTQAYEWSKEHVEWLTQKFCESPKIACVTAGVGLWGLYTYWFNNKKAREEKKAQEKFKAAFTVLSKDHEDVKNGHEALRGEYDTLQVVHNMRIKFLEQKNEQNDKAHKSNDDAHEFYDASLLVMQGKLQQLQDENKANEIFKNEGLGILTLLNHKVTALEQMAEYASSNDEGRVVSVRIKEVEEFQPKGDDTPVNLHLKISALAKMMKSDNVRYSIQASPDDERVQSVIIKEEPDKTVAVEPKRMSHILVPKEGYYLLNEKIGNLEKIVLRRRTTAESFGVGAELIPSRIDELDEGLAQLQDWMGQMDFEVDTNKKNIIKIKKRLTKVEAETKATKEAVEDMIKEIRGLQGYPTKI